MTNWQIAAALALVFVVGAQPEVAVATEQVPYTVERTLESGVEIRRYEETVVAETVIDAGSYGPFHWFLREARMNWGHVGRIR